MLQEASTTFALDTELDANTDPPEDFVRLPGLLRRWELAQVVEPGAAYRIEEAGAMDDGTTVFAVYHRTNEQSHADTAVPVSLSFEPDVPAVRARILPIHDGHPLMAVVVLADQPDDPQAVARFRSYLTRCVRGGERTARTTRDVAAPEAHP